jgi:endonuclease G, mitochondrial
MKLIRLLIFSLLVSCQSIGPTPDSGPRISVDQLPRLTVNESEVYADHGYFVVSFNEEHQLPNWVFYKLSKSDLKNSRAKRKDRFFADPILKSKNVMSLSPQAFAKSGYDRGHLAPSADFQWSQEANDRTFVMSNMVPQSKGLNRSAWKILEERIRNWACHEGELRVATGPVLEPNLKTLASGAKVPKRFFKAVLDDTPPRKTIAFVYHQNDRKDVYKERAMSVKDLEKMTRIDFFSDLEDLEENKIESTYRVDEWMEGTCD